MNISRMEPQLSLAQGPGNSQWETGTGHIARWELGCLLPGKILKSQVQPYGAATYKNFEALDQASVQFDLGVNLLSYGNRIKWTLQFSTRPIYNSVEGKNIITDTKGEIILQTQIWF